MRARRMVIQMAPIGILAAGCFFLPKETPAKPDYTRRTNKDCEFCHPPNSRELNEAGKYFQQHKNSLVGYVPKEQASQDKKKAATPSKSQ